ncbi:hypothetical protein [Pseudomonas oryzihabitans]|uniref:hypothetical protein n=1 Tax=Pseudomonas oryzihabitans TaxID=47885 RepID=UPI00094421EA|nr:hypothetical protein [Pseudomonas psychrotolerans]NMY91727.1 hypothetical protein [Pseudomonas psychrotolerans]NMY92060.1 hypothetical protein [Pseudomonas psychrotolerans]
MKKRHHCILIGIATLPPVAAWLALYWLGWPSATVIDQHVRLWVFGSLAVVCAIAILLWLTGRDFDAWIYGPVIGLWCSLLFAPATDLPAGMMVFFEVCAALVMLGGLILALADHWSSTEPSRSARHTEVEPQPVDAMPASTHPVEPQLLQQPNAAPVEQRVGIEQPAAAGTDTGHVGRRLFLDEEPQA